MNKSIVCLALVIIALFSTQAVAQCTWTAPSGAKYDFSNGGTSEFSITDGYTYTFMFCGGTPANADCAKTGNGCILDTGDRFLIALSAWNDKTGPTITERKEGGLTLEFSNGGTYPSGNVSQVQVDLDCQSDAAFSKASDSIAPFTHFIIAHSIGCPLGGESNGLSGGAIFLIIFFSVLAGYFIIGAILCKFVFKKNGLDIIPQRGFWCALPGFFIAGVKYLIGCFTKKKGGSESTEYSSDSYGATDSYE